MSDKPKEKAVLIHRDGKFEVVEIITNPETRLIGSDGREIEIRKNELIPVGSHRYYIDKCYRDIMN